MRIRRRPLEFDPSRVVGEISRRDVRVLAYEQGFTDGVLQTLWQLEEVALPAYVGDFAPELRDRLREWVEAVRRNAGA